VLDELREIARGLHPALLADGGLQPALKTLARRSALPVDLDIRVQGRLLEPVEIAAYYAVAEALTNTAKHARATAVQIEVAEGDGVLHIDIRDNGHGGADYNHGSGLVGLKDRAEALGGHLQLLSPPGAGTDLEITLPLTDPGGPELPREAASRRTMPVAASPLTPASGSTSPKPRSEPNPTYPVQRHRLDHLHPPRPVRRRPGPQAGPARHGRTGVLE
jgi:hypothetical protein